MAYKRKIIFENRLEYKFFMIYKMLPFEMITELVNAGYDRDYASKTVQNIMDNIWEHEKEMNRQRQVREMELLDRECPWGTPY